MAITGFLNLPEDVVPQILARLSVKSLLRFKCVCKSWYALITSTSFITKHLNYASLVDDNTGFALVRWNCRIDNLVNSLLSNEAVELFQDIAMPFFDDGYFSARKYYGPCDGIICVFGSRRIDDDYQIALWNPATRQFKELSYPEVLPCPEDVELFRDDFGYGRDEIGFGLDRKSNDYKVVKIRYFKSKLSQTVLDKPLVEVYNLSTDSWRKIDPVMPTKLQRVNAYSTYLNGTYYWWARDEDGMFVLSFDFAHEVFERIPPPDLNNTYKVDRTVIQLNEFIAVAVGEMVDGWCGKVAVWVLNRDGDRKTWIKQFTIQSNFIAVLGFLRSGEALIRDNVGDLISYDPSTRQSIVRQNYSRDVHSYADIDLQIAIYVGSLVPLKGAYQLDY